MNIRDVQGNDGDLIISEVNKVTDDRRLVKVLETFIDARPVRTGRCVICVVIAKSALGQYLIYPAASGATKSLFINMVTVEPALITTMITFGGI